MLNRHQKQHPKNTGIETFIDDIANLLKIRCPKIEFVECIFESYLPEYGRDMVLAMQEFYPDEIPKDARFNGAYYFDDRDLILVSKKYINVEFGHSKRIFKDLTEPEKLFLLAHELRHIWQKKYAKNTYYEHNAICLETLTDIAEIDADAFAFSYFFSDRTFFTYADIPSLFDELCLSVLADKHKRWQRIKEISEEYHLDVGIKTKEVKANINHDKIDPYLTYMRLSGMI